MYLKRKVYKDLLDWKQQNCLTLEVSGTRQAGKTFIINQFADEQFARKLYINMLENSGKGQAATGQKALDDQKPDYLVMLKGNTMGGRTEKVLTIPIYLFSRFRFDG